MLNRGIKTDFRTSRHERKASLNSCITGNGKCIYFENPKCRISYISCALKSDEKVTQNRRTKIVQLEALLENQVRTGNNRRTSDNEAVPPGGIIKALKWDLPRPSHSPDPILSHYYLFPDHVVNFEGVQTWLDEWFRFKDPLLHRRDIPGKYILIGKGPKFKNNSAKPLLSVDMHTSSLLRRIRNYSICDASCYFDFLRVLNCAINAGLMLLGRILINDFNSFDLVIHFPRVAKVATFYIDLNGWGKTEVDYVLLNAQLSTFAPLFLKGHEVRSSVPTWT